MVILGEVVRISVLGCNGEGVIISVLGCNGEGVMARV